MFGKGISAVGSLLEAALQTNLVEKAGSWYSYGKESDRPGRGERPPVPGVKPRGLRGPGKESAGKCSFPSKGQARRPGARSQRRTRSRPARRRSPHQARPRTEPPEATEGEEPVRGGPRRLGQGAFLTSSPRIHATIIALGSNLGDRERTFVGHGTRCWRQGTERQAVQPLRVRAHVRHRTSPCFLNAVGKICARELAPERHAGGHPRDRERPWARDRSREVRMGPRTVDLDILLCDDLVMDDSRPHHSPSAHGGKGLSSLCLSWSLPPTCGIPERASVRRRLPASAPAVGGVYSYPRPVV